MMVAFMLLMYWVYDKELSGLPIRIWITDCFEVKTQQVSTLNLAPLK